MDVNRQSKSKLIKVFLISSCRAILAFDCGMNPTQAASTGEDPAG